MTQTYQTGAYLLIQPHGNDSRLLVPVRVENCPEAPASVLRGRDHGYLAYPTREEAEAAAAALSQYGRDMAVQADRRQSMPDTLGLYPTQRHWQHLSVEYSATEVVLVEA